MSSLHVVNASVYLRLLNSFSLQETTKKYWFANTNVHRRRQCRQLISILEKTLCKVQGVCVLLCCLPIENKRQEPFCRLIYACNVSAERNRLLWENELEQRTKATDFKEIYQALKGKISLHVRIRWWHIYLIALCTVGCGFLFLAHPDTQWITVKNIRLRCQF